MPTLYGNADDACIQKVLIAARYANVEIELNSEGEGNKHFHTLETEEGSIFGGNAIARYVARLGGEGNLYGSSSFESALVDQWIDYSVGEIELPASAWLFPIKGLIPNHATATSKAKGDIRTSLKFLDEHLLTRTFLVGERISLADIVVGLSLLDLYRLVLDSGFCKQFNNTNRWFKTLIHQENFSAVLGEVDFCKKMAVAPAAPDVVEEKVAEKPKKEKQEPQPKKEKPKKVEEADDEPAEESFEDDKPRTKNPLDLLPPSKLVLDEWKRVYSNEETRGVAIPWFWEHFDAAGYSIWFCDYKFNNECQKTFMTCNLVGGFFQRLETLHKYAFGSMLIFGEEPSLEVSGVWVYRGTGTPADMESCDDYPHYNWRQADISDPAQRTLIEDYFAWDGNLGGKHFNTGKVFK